MLLNILYWVFLVLGAIVGFIPDSAGPHYRYGRVGFILVLLVIIGLRAFRVSFD